MTSFGEALNEGLGPGARITALVIGVAVAAAVLPLIWILRSARERE